uniref:Uncharacterized protein n=1 Tax=Arundo donax TaxID=35708 RepID=A0A0A9FXP1_ARUDO
MQASTTARGNKLSCAGSRMILELNPKHRRFDQELAIFAPLSALKRAKK